MASQPRPKSALKKKPTQKLDDAGGGLVTQEAVEKAVATLREFLLKKFGSKDGVIKALDQNGDQHLTFEEFDLALVHNDVNVKEVIDVELKRVFQDLDVDGTNDLSIEELMETNPFKAEEEAVVLLRKALQEQIGGREAVIYAMDEDKSGTVSYGELERSLQLHGISVMDATCGIPLGRIYDLLDADCSGELSWVELLDSDPRTASRECEQTIAGFRDKLVETFGSKQKAVSKLDTNGNGQLSYSELKQGLDSSGIPMTGFLGNKDFRWLFRMLDGDGSGQIDANELVDSDPMADARRLAQARRKKSLQRRKTTGLGSRGSSRPTSAKKTEGKSIEEYELECQNLRSELNSLKAKLKEAEKANEKKDANAKAKAELSKMKKEHAQLLADYQALLSQGPVSDEVPAESTLPELEVRVRGEGESENDMKSRKLQEKVNAMQRDNLTLKCDILQMESRHAEIAEETTRAQEEAAQFKNLYHTKHKQLMEEHARCFEELKLLKAEHLKTEAEHQKLREQHQKLQEDHGRSEIDPRKELRSLQDNHDELQEELKQVKEEYNQFQVKHKQLRFGLTSDWESISRSGNALSQQARPATSAGVGLPRMHGSRSATDIVDLAPLKEVLQLPTTLDDRPNSRAELKKRMSAINGQVRYCNDMWTEWYRTNGWQQEKDDEKDATNDSAATRKSRKKGSSRRLQGTPGSETASRGEL